MMMLVLIVTILRLIFLTNNFTQYLPHPLAPDFPPHTNSIHSIYIEYEVYSASTSLDINKATGIDGVDQKFLNTVPYPCFNLRIYIYTTFLTLF